MRALSALTVELAQAEARSATRRVLLALLLAYVLSFQAGLWFMQGMSKTKAGEPMPPAVPLAVLAVSVILGLVHYRGARRVGLDRVLERLGVPSAEQGVPAEALRRFRNVVEEAALAAGLKGVRALV